jgi:hypothetical protein
MVKSSAWGLSGTVTELVDTQLDVAAMARSGAKVTSQLRGDSFDASSDGPPRDEADSLFHRLKGFLRNSTFHRATRRVPEGVAE